MIVSAVLSLLLAVSPRASAAVALRLETFAPSVSVPLPLVAPSAALSPLAAAPALAASPVPALAATAVPVPAAAARPALERASSSAPEAAAASFDGGRPAAEADGTPGAERGPFLYRHQRLLRAAVLPVLSLLYNVRVDGRALVPPGPALIVPNHVSFLDPLLVWIAADRPLHFLMYRPYYEIRGLQWLFRSLGVIPVSPEDPKDVVAASLNRARRALAEGESVVIFPEGQITRDGNLSRFRRGFERIARGLDVPVVPARVDGMWGSALSRHPDKSGRRSLLAHLLGRRPVSVRFGPPLERADAEGASEAVAHLAASR